MRTFLCLFLAACSGGAGVGDASMDAAPDGATDAAEPDAASCAPACTANQICCAADDGLLCRNRRSDVRHCGVCGMDCITSHRGDACELGVCVCGGQDGRPCTGSTASTCCPPRALGQLGYCGDLDHSPVDCGACNFACDGWRSDHCDGGECLCGDTRAQCDGTATSRCCALSLVEAGCVDTTTDASHCGGCGRTCFTDERCAESTCTVGAEACVGGCSDPDICCAGVCCSRRACAEGACSP